MVVVLLMRAGEAPPRQHGDRLVLSYGPASKLLAGFMLAPAAFVAYAALHAPQPTTSSHRNPTSVAWRAGQAPRRAAALSRAAQLDTRLEPFREA